MRTVPMFVVLVAVGCSADPIEGDDVCEESATTVANRVYACTADRDRANAAAQALWDLGCAAEDVQDTANVGTIGNLLQCVEAQDGMTCDQVAAGLDDPEAWLVVDPNCATVWGAQADTGAVP